LLWRSQNFLRDDAVDTIGRLARVRADDVVVEIGPGRGVITRRLAAACARVIAVERDAALCRLLRREFGSVGNVEIVSADFLHWDLPRGEYRVVANLPYEITSEIMAKLTRPAQAPAEAHLVVQVEAARRFAGAPHDRESLKSLLLKPRFTLSLVHALRRTDFRPVPGVDSVLVHLHRRRPPLLGAAEDRAYRDFLCFVFSERGADTATRLRRVFTTVQLRRLARDNGFSLSAPLPALSFAHWLAVFRHYAATAAPERQRMIQGAEQRLRLQQRGLTKLRRSRPG
jgi:23S rRNA (adenine-N6)-dimethyltransferase